MRRNFDRSQPHKIHLLLFLSRDEVEYLIDLTLDNRVREDQRKYQIRNRIREELQNALQPISRVVRDRLEGD